MSSEQFRAFTFFNSFFSGTPWAPLIQQIITFLMVLGIGCMVIILMREIMRNVVLLCRLFIEPLVILEITPPDDTDKSAYTTKQFFSAIHDLLQRRTFFENVLGIDARISLEIISTKELGIRYLLCVPQKQEQNIKHHLLSFLPGINVVQTPEDFQTPISPKITEVGFTKHAAFPLQKQDNLEEHDPVSYITGMMTKLDEKEFVGMQLLLTPGNIAEKAKLHHMIYRGEDVLSYLNSFHLSSPSHVLLLPLYLAIKSMVLLLTPLLGAINVVLHDLSDAPGTSRVTQFGSQTKESTAHRKPARVLTSFEQEAIQAIAEKIEQKVFRSQLRFFVSMKNPARAKAREQGLLSTLAVFSGVHGQQLRKRAVIASLTPYLSFLYTKRLMGLFLPPTRTLLSLSEIADIYHFPITSVTKTENLVTVHSKQLPAPLSLKQQTTLDVIFAKNTYGGTSTLIGLSQEERRRHMYIIGATGTGKSTLLLSMIQSDIHSGKGVAVVDPHGELAERVLSCVPDSRISDVIYLNPDDLTYPIGLNLLELTPNLSEEDTLREKEFIAESVISLFRKVFSDSMAGNPHRIEYILRNTIHTAFTVENCTLFTIFDLLTNPDFQKKVVTGLKDEHLKNFWKHEFGKAGDFQRVKMFSPITSRIGRFLFSPSAKRILEQPKSTINFDEILDTGKILVCNLSKGRLGEDTSQVFGIMILNKIQLASLKRARVQSSQRRDFYLYVDEFQNFATKSFIDILSESRKYKLNLTMAEQSTSQLRDKHLVHTILANAGTVVSFKTANPEDERLILPQFAPYVDTGEIANLPSFHFYMKNSAINPEEPFSGQTILIDKEQDSNLNQIITSSRNLYALKYIPTQNIPTEHHKVHKETKQTASKSGLPED